VTAAIVALCETVVESINAAAEGMEFPKPVRAVEDYAVAIAQEATNDWTIFVEPGPSTMTPGTLSGDIREEIAVRLVMHTRCRSDDLPGVKALLGVVQLAIDAARDGMDETYNHTGLTYQSSMVDANQIYDAVRLRDDGVFYSDAVLNFEILRTP